MGAAASMKHVYSDAMDWFKMVRENADAIVFPHLPELQLVVPFCLCSISTKFHIKKTSIRWIRMVMEVSVVHVRI